MKYFFGFLIIGSTLVACTANDAKSTNTATDSSVTTTAAAAPASTAQIQWVDSMHQDLGKIKEGGVVEVTWKFKNTGEGPLIVSNVNASCGCTVAEKPEAPVAPGSEGVIKAKFDSKGREGAQRKDVFVTTNAGATPQQLSFAVEVQK